MDSERWNREEELFHQALEQDECRRADFLERECGDDTWLRRELESLLVHAKEAEEFIESPALLEMGKLLADETLAAGNGTVDNLADLLGSVVSHYRVMEKLGSGGMGLVYKAEDIRLHRFVALKFLSQYLARDPRWLARFELEAQAASALNHPNICTIYEIGEHNNDTFIAMELLEGRTLREVIAEGSLPVELILDLGIQIADALETAHRNGIIHRDLKPANIFVSARDHAKLLDFGIAKIGQQFVAAGAGDAPSDSPVEQHLTDRGATLGTAAYMSPEQVRGEELDARTDLFSFGVVLYEMATGDRPFKGQTSGAIAAAVLHETPASPFLLKPSLPPKLAAIMTRALEKDCALRYQHASDMYAELKRLKREIEAGDKIAPGHGTLPARRKTLQRIALAGSLAIAVAGGALFYRLHQSKPPLTERDTVVLADFTNETDDAVLSDALKQALAIELGQSPFLNVLSDQRVNDTLQLMGRPANTRITEDMGREICQRTGSKALLGGEVSALGQAYVINLNAIACGTGETLAREQVQANDKEHLLAALNRASSSLRAKLGESLPSLQKYASPIEATTSSLDALNSYSMGIRLRAEKGDEAGIPLLRRAIELDPNFPMAYAELATSYANLFQPSLAIQNATKAYELRDRASEREKLRIAATYFRITGQMERAAEAYQLWIASYPRDLVPYVRLSVTYADMGQYEMARSEYLEALRFAPNEGHLYANLGEMYIALNRLDDAKSTFDDAIARKLDDEDMHEYIYLLAFLGRDHTQMEQQLAWAAGRPGVEDELLSTQSDTEAYYGRVRSAREFSQRAVDSALRANSKEAAAYWQVNCALREAELGNLAQAREGVAAALAWSQGEQVKIVAALTLARIGDPKAEMIAKQLKQEYPANSLLKVYWLPTIAASLALRRGNVAEAIAQLKVAEPYESGVAGTFINYLYPAYIRGQAYLMAHDGNAAAAEFQKLPDHTGIVTNFVTGSLAHLQIARAYVAAGNRDAAKTAYEDFLALWKNADPDIPLLKEARSEYAKL